MDLVSVIVVTYNAESTILETLNSIYNQTYPRMELIVADDYSTDNTREIIENWCKVHSRRFEKVLIRKPNKNLGVVRNMNCAVRHSKGKWIAILAGDDFWNKNCIERKVTYVNQNQVETVLTKVHIFGGGQKSLNEMKSHCIKGYQLLRGDIEKQYEAILEGNFIAGPMGIFYSREFFDRIGGYDERFPAIEDWPLYYKLIKQGYRMPFLEEELAWYRISDSSLCHSNKYILNPFTRSLKSFFYKERLWDLLKAGKIKYAWQQHLYFQSLK